MDKDSGPVGWIGELSRSKHGPHAIVANAMIILRNDKNTAGTLAFDEFAHQVVVTREVPRAIVGLDALPGPYPRQLTESDVTSLQSYVQQAYGLHVSVAIMHQAAACIAEHNRYHPVVDYLSQQVWDGVPRLATMFVEAFGTPNDAYHQAVAVKFMCAAVRRIRHPGCKFDHVLILEGAQGAGKSRACAALASPAWFKDDLAHDLSDKDAQQGMAGKWIVELAEVQFLVRSTSQAAKAFISRQVDHYRPSYGRTFVQRPRGSVFVGTTNEKDYLTDATGNRRYWPIECVFVDVEWIEANRDQLWAEAAQLEPDTKLWLDDDAVREVAEAHQDDRMASDVWEQTVSEYLRMRGLPEATTADILWMALAVPRDRQNRASEMRVAKVMGALGWDSRRCRHEGQRVRDWVKVSK